MHTTCVHIGKATFEIAASVPELVSGCVGDAASSLDIEHCLSVARCIRVAQALQQKR